MSTVFENVLQAMRHKKSDVVTAERLGMSLSEYQSIKQEIRRMQREEEDSEDCLAELQRSGFAVGYTEDLEKGNAEYKVQTSYEPRTAEEIEKLIKLDKTKWKLARYSVWNGGKEDVWLTSAKVTAIINSKEDNVIQFQEFLKTYQPEAVGVFKKQNTNTTKSCLIINKQDAHLNKLDLNGSNNIEERFETFYQKTNNILKKTASTTTIKQIIYVLGSDEFNSEFTNRTTHDTPQQNVCSYEKGFEHICNHEISIINLLREYSTNVKVIYIIGNHDTYSGWHLVNWLKTYYRNSIDVSFDDSMEYTKYVKFDNTALCFNHGYRIKPEQMVLNFPIEFKEHWSSCDNFYCFAGDKHTEMSKTIGGVKFYRLAQISKAKSDYDKESGFTPSKGELTAFVVEEKDGLTGISYQPL